MVVTGDGRKSIGNQVVVGKPRFDLNNVPLFAEIIHGVNEQQLHTTIGSLGKPLGAALFKLFLGHVFFLSRAVNEVDLLRSSSRLPQSGIGKKG